MLHKISWKSLFLLFISVLFFIPKGTYSQANSIFYLEWVNNPLETIIINWIDEPYNDAILEYRERSSSNSWNGIQADEYTLPNSGLIRYRAMINSLQPGTSYEFRTDHSNELRYFRTAPAQIDESISFIVGSDVLETRGDEVQVSELQTVFEEVTEIAAENNPLFIIFGGDFVHNEGPYPDIEDWFYMLEYWSDNLRTYDGNYMIPFISAIGNHEAPNRYGDSPADAIYYHGFLSYPQEQWDGIRSYGVLDFSDYLSVITLDTGHTHSVRSQTGWLRNTIENRTNQTHVLPVYHVPGWPTFRTMRDGTGLIDDVRNEWHPIFRDNDIRFVFEHHDHSYKRTNAFVCEPPINNALACEENEDFGVIYLGGGTWGSVVRDLHPGYTSGSSQWVHAVNELENNFVLVELSESIRKISAVSLTRGVVDEFIDYIKMSPPAEISIHNLTETSFSLSWSEVEGSDEYHLDIAYDDQFMNILPEYNNIIFNNVETVTVENLPPDTNYFIRMRTRNVYDVSDYSEVVRAALIPTSPIILSATGEEVTRFTANWQEVNRTTGYVIDVSDDENFLNLLDGFNAKHVGNTTSADVENLIPGVTYYYRVRALFEDLMSKNSSVETAQTTGINLDQSGIEASLQRILANGQQTSQITVILVGDDGEPLEGVDVRLLTESNGVIIEPQGTGTDQNGVINFVVSSDDEGFTNFSAWVGNYDLNLSIGIEFIEVLQEPKLGHNFPNPFTNQTLIPVTLPESGRIRIEIVNYTGARVQTIIDEEKASGYYEIPFNASGIAAGVYLIRMVTESGMQINKMTIL